MDAAGVTKAFLKIVYLAYDADGPYQAIGIQNTVLLSFFA